MLGHPLGEGAAGEVRHHERDLVAVVEHLEELDDVGVVEAGEHLGLPLDPLPGPGHVLGGPCRVRRLSATSVPSSRRPRSTTPIPPRPSRATRS